VSDLEDRWQFLLTEGAMTFDPERNARVVNTTTPIFSFIAALLAPDGVELCVDDWKDGYALISRDGTVDIRIRFDHLEPIEALAEALVENWSTLSA
jgi:hypothetical protein